MRLEDAGSSDIPRGDRRQKGPFVRERLLCAEWLFCNPGSADGDRLRERGADIGAESGDGIGVVERRPEPLVERSVTQELCCRRASLNGIHMSSLTMSRAVGQSLATGVLFR